MSNNFIELDSKQAWLRLIIIFTMSVIGTAGMWSVVIMMPNIQNEFGLDRAASTYPYVATMFGYCLLYTSPSPRDRTRSRMPSSA